MNVASINLLQSLLGSLSGITTSPSKSSKTASSTASGVESLFSQILGATQNFSGSDSAIKISQAQSSSSIDSSSLQQILLMALSVGAASGKCPLAKALSGKSVTSQEKEISSILNDLISKKNGAENDLTTTAIAALNPVTTVTPDTRIVGGRGGQGALESTSTVQSTASAKGFNLNALLQQLTNFLRRLADLVEEAGQDSSKSSSSDLSTLKSVISTAELKNTEPANTSFTPTTVDPTKILSKDTSAKTQASASNKTDSVLPDLIYIVAAEKETNKPVPSLTAGEMKVVVVPRDVESNSVQVLKKLIDRIDNSVGETDKSADSSLNASLQHFLMARTSQPAAASSKTSLDQLAALVPIQNAQITVDDRVNAVRQAQAVMADMVDRMSGAVALDSQHQRAVIHLEPPTLGRVHVNLSIDDSQTVLAQITADNASTRDFLRQNQQDLRQGLAQQGFKPEKIDIKFSGDEREAFTRYLSSAAYSV